MVGGTAQNRPTVTLRAAGNKVTGTVGDQPKVAGERPPTWGACDANASQSFGKPVTLFDGKSLDAWGVQKDKPIGWSIEEGVMTNAPKANNLVSKEKFRDFRLDAEYKLSEKGNSGIYLRGRYEMQVLDDFGRTDGRRARPHVDLLAQGAEVNASKPAGEWQTAQITIVGNCVIGDAERPDDPRQLEDCRHHRRRARRQGDRAGPDHDPGRPREGVVPEGGRHADREQAE